MEDIENIDVVEQINVEVEVGAVLGNGSTWLFETIPGSDALLISAPNLPNGLPLQPTLGPEELKNLADGAPLNTDDYPWIEFEAPKWVNRPTGTMNRTIIENARSK